MHIELTPKAVRIIADLLRKEIRSLALDASLYETYSVDTPHGRKCAERRKELLAILNGLNDQAEGQES